MKRTERKIDREKIKKKRKKEERVCLTAKEHQQTLPTSVARFPKCRRVVATLQNLALKRIRSARADVSRRTVV